MPTETHIADELDKMKALVQPVDNAIEQLSKLVGSHEGPLFDAIGKLQDDIARRVAASVGCSYELISDWWLTHEFGATPMVVTVDRGPRQFLCNNADMAAFLSD